MRSYRLQLAWVRRRGDLRPAVQKCCNCLKLNSQCMSETTSMHGKSQAKRRLENRCALIVSGGRGKADCAIEERSAAGRGQRVRAPCEFEGRTACLAAATNIFYAYLFSAAALDLPGQVLARRCGGRAVHGAVDEHGRGSRRQSLALCAGQLRLQQRVEHLTPLRQSGSACTWTPLTR